MERLKGSPQLHPHVADTECASTILEMYHKAFFPQRVFTGAVAYVAAKNHTEGERCDDASLFQYRKNINTVVANHTDARGPTLARW